MPEGHKTHFTARQQNGLLSDQRVKVSSPQGRFAADAKKVSGRILESVEAAGKRIFYLFEGGRIIHVHLGRYDIATIEIASRKLYVCRSCQGLSNQGIDD